MKREHSVNIRFWGVRGSIASPETHASLEIQFTQLLSEFIKGKNKTEKDIANFLKAQREIQPLTYGGNTSCVEIRYGKRIFILDMGTGMRPLGNSLMGQLFADGALEVCCMLSHVHWDHIQGLPFFPPIHMSKYDGYRNRFHFYGGTDWQKNVEAVLQGQMDEPNFPVSWEEITAMAEEMHFQPMVNSLKVTPFEGGPEVRFGKLNHPQETYGMRFEFPDGPIIVYATDNEPYDPKKPDPKLLRLTKNADVLIIDCQYTKAQYEGTEGGVPRHGWGHSYPEAIVETALQANVKCLVLFHHDPSSNRNKITEIKKYTESLLKTAGSNTQVMAAWEGMEIIL